jgi:hypothetical protein
LCKELAVGAQRAGGDTRNFHNLWELNVLYRQFLENLAGFCSEKRAWNDHEEGQGRWNTSKIPKFVASLPRQVLPGFAI